jgi:hypothetical protein
MKVKEAPKRVICGVVGPDGKPCVRTFGHVGIHTDEGTDIGPSATGKDRARRCKYWR